ncbi:MAG: AfsR/SARP family transcriptional regulator [Acidimicrobiales bacterium]
MTAPNGLRVALTGHAGIHAGDGEPLVEASGVGRLGRLAFAYLVTGRDRPVPREELADVLWGDDLPRTWETSLRVVVSRLRSWLSSAGLDRSGSLTSGFGCYQLHLPEGTRVDVEEAVTALARARASLGAGDSAEAYALAGAAGDAAAQEFLPGASGAWVERRQAEWRELRVGALETQAEAALASGDPRAAVVAAEHAADLEPLREPAHVLLIRALAHAGNRADALRAYEHLRRTLADELGVPPSPQTEATYLSLLRDEPEVPAAAFRPRRPAAVLHMTAAMIGWVLAELTLGFVVFCADAVGDDKRPPAARLTRAALWMVTLPRWFTHRNVVKLARFGAVVWFLVTTGWLLTLEYDRMGMPLFLLLAEATMAFVVYCVDSLSSDLENKPGHRLLRSLFWVGPVTAYLSDDDGVRMVTASVTIWVLLITGWLLGLLADRVASPLGAMG